MMGPPTAQHPPRSRSGSKLETKTRHRLSGSVSDVPYTPEELSPGDVPGSGNSASSPSASLKDKKFRRRTRSSLGGTEDLVKELDTLVRDGTSLRASNPSRLTTPAAGGRPGDSPAIEYPALKAQPSDPVEDLERTVPVISSQSDSIYGDSSSDKESVTSGQKALSSERSNQPTTQGTVTKETDSSEGSNQPTILGSKAKEMDPSVRPAVSHPDVVELETQPGSAVELKAGAYSTNDDKDLWICRQCGWTYPNAHPSAKQRRNHKKVCEKHYTGVEVPNGSSDEVSSDDELHREDQVSTAGSSTATPQAAVKTDAKDETVKKLSAVPGTFVKPTISTASDSAKNSPVTSPSKRDSPFTSPARRDSHLTSPAKKETPWGSPIKRNTPVSSPSKKVSSPITSPVKRILSTPVKKYSPPRPEKQEFTRSVTAKQRQEEEERKISVKSRIEELERIASSKPHTWKDYVSEGKKSGELSASGSPLRHADDDRRRSADMSPGGKTLKHVEAGGRKSLDFSPSRQIQSSKKSGELSSTGSPLTHSSDVKASKTPPIEEVAELHPSFFEDQKTNMADAAPTSLAEDGKVVAPVMKSIDSKMPENIGMPVKDSEGSDVKGSVKDAASGAPVEKVPYEGAVVVTTPADEVQAVDATIVPIAENVQAAEHTVPSDQKVEGESGVVLLEKSSRPPDEDAKRGAVAAAHSRSPSFVSEKGDVPLLTGADASVDHGLSALRTTKPSEQIVNAENDQTEVRVPEGRSNVEASPTGSNTPLDTEKAIVEEAVHDTLSAKEEPVVVVDPSSVNEQSSAVASPVEEEERVQRRTSSTSAGDSSDAAVAETKEEKNEVPSTAQEAPSPSDAGVEHVKEKMLSSEVPSESRSVKEVANGNAVENVSPSPRPVDHDDDNSVLLIKQPAVDPLFVESQQDRLWEMHSQELTRRDGEASGTDVRESSAQDDDPIQYANGSPLTPDASATGATSNGNGVNEKGGKVDRPRTPLRSLIAEDDAADKGDDGAPTGKETPIVSPRGNIFKRIVSGGKASPTKPSTPSMYEKKSHSKPFLSSCICCSPVK